MTDTVVATRNRDPGFVALVSLIPAAIAAAVVTILFFDTSASMVATWARSETFTHGFFVLPIFLWLVWREREAIAGQHAAPDFRQLPLIAGAGALWLVSRVADLLAGQQLALVLIMIFVIRAFTGPAIARTLRFPLLFLLFLAPLGEELMPILMDITADLTVGAIALTGIPIYREGLFFSLPSGDWSVVEACSGIRYLIASVVLGALYAHLYIEGVGRKLLFLALSAAVPILANGARAFLIVMIGHFSSMRLATGVDHFVYGWLFFGVVMFLLFSVGALFRRRESGSIDEGTTRSSASGGERGHFVAFSVSPADRVRTSSSGRPLLHIAMTTACVLLWPLWAGAVDAREARIVMSDAAIAHLLPVDEASPAEIDARVTTWRPQIAGHDYLSRAVLDADAEQSPVLALAYVYAEQRQGKEMIASGNVLVRSRDPDWRRVETGRTTLPSTDGKRPVTLTWNRLESSGQSVIVWRWYRVGDTMTGETSRAKLLEARDRLLLRTVPSVSYVLAADATNDVGAAERALADAFDRIAASIGSEPDGGSPARLAGYVKDAS